MLVAPTGSGKTHVAAEMIRSALEKSRNVLFLAPRRELIYQTSERLDRSGIRYGVIMAGEPTSMMARVQVASVNTLGARAIRRQRIWLPKADLVMVDEAHIGIGGECQKIIEHYKEAGSVVVGLTATPCRGDGRGLGAVYDALVLGPSVAELMTQGHLVPARYFVGERPDLAGVKLVAGDYHEGQLAERTDQPKLVGDLVSNWLRLARDRQTFVFAVNVEHSRHVAEEFRRHGIRAEQLDAQTPLDQRKSMQSRMRSGETQVLVNCEVLTYGVDFPPVSCIQLARATKSVAKYLQMAGRGLRTFDGKADCLMLDHIGAVSDPSLGFVDDLRLWSLDGKEKIHERQAEAPKPPKDIQCVSCGTTFRAAPVCPKCGHEMRAAHAKAIEAVEADLVEVDRKAAKKSNRELSIEEKARFYGELKAYAERKGFAPGWAAHAYRTKTGVWPNDARVREAEPREPGGETLSWIKYLNIRRAKSRRAA